MALRVVSLQSGNSVAFGGKRTGPRRRKGDTVWAPDSRRYPSKLAAGILLSFGFLVFFHSENPEFMNLINPHLVTVGNVLSLTWNFPSCIRRFVNHPNQLVQVAIQAAALRRPTQNDRLPIRSVERR
jgi:hypothetical protein